MKCPGRPGAGWLLTGCREAGSRGGVGAELRRAEPSGDAAAPRDARVLPAGDGTDTVSLALLEPKGKPAHPAPLPGCTWRGRKLLRNEDLSQSCDSCQANTFALVRGKCRGLFSKGAGLPNFAVSCPAAVIQINFIIGDGIAVI